MARSNMVLVLIAVLGLCAAAFYKHNPVTQSAQGYAQDVAVASAGTYVTLRTLNAVLSTAQEVELGGSVIVSGSVQPLKALEPIDDTIERIAGVVFALMVVTGVLAIAMGPMGAVGWIMVGLAGLVWLAGRDTPLGRFGRQLASYGAFLALALPLAFVLASFVADRMTRDVWAEHQATVAEITGDIQIGAPGEDEPGWMESIDSYRKIATAIYARADELVTSYVALLSVFIFKIFILPLMLSGGFFLLARALARGRNGLV